MLQNNRYHYYQHLPVAFRDSTMIKQAYHCARCSIGSIMLKRDLHYVRSIAAFGWTEGEEKPGGPSQVPLAYEG